MRLQFCSSNSIPRFCVCALPKIPTKTVALCRSLASRISFTLTNPTSFTGNSRRIISPSSRFNNSRTRSSLKDITTSKSNLRLGRDFFDRVRFDHVARLIIAKAVDANTAFHTGAHFVDLILEPAQRLNNSFVNQSLATHDARLAFDDTTAADHATGNVAAF